MKLGPFVLSAMLLLNSCGNNPPGMRKVGENTQPKLEETMQAKNNLSMTNYKNVAIPEQVPDYYWPILLPHDAELNALFASLHKGIPEVKREDIAEWENRSSILVGKAILYPYLDEMSIGDQQFFLSKIIVNDWKEWKEWIIVHQGWQHIDTNSIVAAWFIDFVQLLEAGKTVTYNAVPVEDTYH